MAIYANTITQYLGVTVEQLAPHYMDYIDDIDVSSSLDSLIGVVIYERILASDIYDTTGSTYSILLSDTTHMKSIANVTYTLQVLENINLSLNDTDLLVFINLLTEMVYVSEDVATKHEAFNVVISALYINEIISLIDPAIVAENIDITHIEAAEAIANLSFIENITFSDLYTNYVSFFSIVSENFTLDDILLDPANFFSALIEESVVFSVSLNQPTEIEAFILNPENTVISTYSNYNFTSACEFDGNYLYGNTTGLYQMEGTTDTGSYITSKVKTATMDFGISNKKQMPQMYIGVDNESKLILRASIDGRNTAYYQLNLDSQNLDTQMIKLGKGLVGRYWQFELSTKENEGLDIDTIEFYPITFGRKI